MTKMTETTKKFLLGLAGACGAIAGIVALITTIFEWPTGKVTAIVSIAVGLVFIVGWIIDKAIVKVNKNIDDSLSEIKEDIAKNELAAQERSRAHDRSLCRLELSDLMTNDPDNTVAIRKKARHYFCELKGNDWMGDRYSYWANKYDHGDLSILACETKNHSENE